MFAYAIGAISSLFLLMPSMAQLQESELILQHLSFLGAFITRLDRSHSIQPFRWLTVDGMLSCGHACLRTGACSSFSYEVSATRRGLCELNCAGISKEEELRERPGFIYVQPAVYERKARSCLDHKKAGARFSQKYTIYDSQGAGHEVFCDLTSEPGAAWTLVISEISPGLLPIQKTPLYIDSPFMPSQVNWHAHRQPLSWMLDLKGVSTHWRITCSFPLVGAAWTDYVRAKLSQFDLINFRGENACMPVEFIDVRGYACAQCTAAWTQRDDAPIHQNSDLARCDFGAVPGSKPSEDSFGFYDVTNPEFRCTDPEETFSSTNYWLGGYYT